MAILDRSCVALALVAVSCATVSAQTPQTPPAPQEVPVFRVQIWGDTGTSSAHGWRPMPTFATSWRKVSRR